MKKFITNKWIPVFLISLLTLSFLVLKLIGNLNENSIVMILAMIYFPVMFLYLPLLAVTVVRGNYPNKQNIVNNIGLFCLILWLLEFLCKTLLFYNGSGFHIVAGSFIFLTSFLPAWLILKNKQSSFKQRMFNFLLANFLASIVIFGWFNTMHYPFYLYANYYCFLSGIILLPLLVYLLIKREIKFTFKEQFIFIFFIAYILGMRQMAYLRDLRHNSVSTNQEQIEKNLEINKRKALFIYNAFHSTKDKDSLFQSHYEKIKLIQSESDSLQEYIATLKAILVAETANIPRRVADTIKFNKIDATARANYDIPTQILFDSLDEYKHIAHYTILALKKKLLNFSGTLYKFSPEDFKIQFKQYNPIQIIDQDTYEDGLQLTWEITLFNHQTLGAIYTQLTSIQNDAKGAEIIVLNELFNKANQNRKENIAAQLTELSLKYESEKREKQIKLLQKDKELNDSKLLAKDQEISQTRNTLIYFVFALVLFLFLITFVIRTNIQRKKANQLLTEQKIEISNQKEEVEKQKHLVEEKNKEIEDSITYAKRLQEAILPPQDFISRHVPGNFILYKPKDIVAGDFYWAELIDDKFYIAAADSTGHGVPGALVSVVCSNALNRAVKEFNETETGKILDRTRALVLQTFEKSTSDVKDGMDISLLCIDENNKQILWSGANNPLWYIEDNTLHEIKADKQPIGKTDNPKPFTTHRLDYKKNTMFYLFTDGLADQFGGPNGKKFKYKQFSDLLITNKDFSLEQQTAVINKIFEDWKGNLEQVDDVCVIGIKI